MSKFIVGGIAAVVLGLAAIGSGGGAAQAQCICDDSPSSAAGYGGYPVDINYFDYGTHVWMQAVYADGTSSWYLLVY